MTSGIALVLLIAAVAFIALCNAAADARTERELEDDPEAWARHHEGKLKRRRDEAKLLGDRR